MSKTKPNTYDAATVADIRELVKKAPTISDALDLLTKHLKLNRDHTRRLCKRYRFWVDPKIGPTTSLAGRPVRRLFWDIEVSPNVVLSWKTGYKLNIDYDSIVKERGIICICWKWEGKSEVYSLHWDKNQCDKDMLTAFSKVIEQADELVHHNGSKFDLPWFKTRCLFHGLPPIPDQKCIDTLMWARRNFLFNSNRLDYIARFLGLEGKMKTGYGLWKEIVLNKCPKSLATMIDYCKRDVLILEGVWKKLSKQVAHKTHAGVLAGGEPWSCPKDGSKRVYVNKSKVTAAGVVQHTMQCQDCGGYYTISDTAHKAYLEAKAAKAAK